MWGEKWSEKKFFLSAKKNKKLPQKCNFVVICLQYFFTTITNSKQIKTEMLFYFNVFFNPRFHMNTVLILSIIIIIMLCHKHGYPWPSLASSHYRSSPLAGLQGHIPYPHIAAVCMFEPVVLLLPSHMWGSIGVYHLWARPYFSSSVLHVWFV